MSGGGGTVEPAPELPDGGGQIRRLRRRSQPGTQDEMKAVELSGGIDEKHGLRVDQPIPIDGPCRVRVLLLIPEGDELPEDEWRQAAARNPAFAFLNDPSEDIYSAIDGRPLTDEG